MSKEADNTQSEEQKFLGTSHVVRPRESDKEPETKEGVEPSYEVLDDSSPEKRQPTSTQATKKKGPDDDDLADYGKTVQKRIKHLTWKAAEADRRAEKADLMNEEAVRVAQQLVHRNAQLEGTL